MTIIIMQIAVFIAIAWLLHGSAREQIRGSTEQTEKHGSASPGRHTKKIIERIGIFSCNRRINMDKQRIRFLREILITDRNGKSTTTIEFSYDDRFVRKPRFFDIPIDEEAQARQLYLEWGGVRHEGQRLGTIVGHP
jgi:hypothetical protein